MKKIKVALIGTGNWSLQHCRILSQNPQVEFCGILGRNKERTEERKNGITKGRTTGRKNGRKEERKK